MKNVIKFLFVSLIFLASCEKNIDRYPLNNISINNYYKTSGEIQIALNGCYAGLRSTMIEEWQLTEQRSDNTIMGNAGSTSVPNREKSDLDLFIPSTSLAAIYIPTGQPFIAISGILI
jgi:starch-binding outer membrane protein, SusD/RagB family